MGAILKFSGKTDKPSPRGKTQGKVVAYPGVNMREIEEMFQYLKRRDSDGKHRR